jgi:magnesium-transporting ATPase (P-type)
MRSETTQITAKPDESATEVESWHSESAAEVARKLEVDPETGLSAAEARQRLERYGPNRLPEEERESAFVRFLKQFHNVLIYILLIAAVFTAFLGEWIDTGVILAVVVVNAIIGFVQEGKAEHALESIRKMLSLEATVLRDGRRRRISAEELVPGDLVLLEGGDRVPADLRIFTARNARAEEAALTGESQPVSKSAEPVAEDALLGDRRSLAFSGTMVTSGQLRGIVIATGEKTEIGRIGEMVARVEKLTTPLLQKIDQFGKQLSIAILLLAALLFAFGWFYRGYTLNELFLIVVSFAVAAIPEGLPAILTITLALGVQRMAQRNAIIRRLPAVETLGSVTTICSDKTGTLTRNEMMAGRVVTAAEVTEVTGAGYRPDGSFQVDGEERQVRGDPVLEELVRGGVLCNDAEFTEEESGETKLQGDPTEGALLVLGMKAGLEPREVARAYRRVDAIPFESENRFMATLHEHPDGGRLIYVKGAPERILEMCDAARGEQGDGELRHEAWEERISAVAADGFRMLAVGVREVEKDKDTLRASDLEGVTLLGAVGLIDPPRPEAIEAVAKCRRTGIRVKMITGDHALTALSIGAQMGIGDGTSALTGADLEGTSDERLVELIDEHDVIARSSPEHKLRLVRALQARGDVTAMTGDGVNDAPALKQADIGVAMGIKGSEAAKSASEMVLADDNFASIEHAVEEGRTVYDNLKKTILFILPTNGAESLMVISAVAFAYAELPITPVQILWVNMITAVTLALALAFEPTEPGIMERPPRRRDEAILSGYLLWRIALVSVIVSAAAQYLFLEELAAGASPELARTAAVNALVAGQLFYLFNCRYIMRPSYGLRRLVSNRAALIAVALLIVFQGIFTYVPIFQTWFGTQGLEAEDWLWVLAVGAAVFVIVEIEKAVVRRIRARGERQAAAAA